MLNENSNLKWMTKKDLKAEGEKSQYTCELGIVSGYFPHLAPCLGIFFLLGLSFTFFLEKFHGDEIHKYMKNFKQAKKLGYIN